MRIQLDNNVAEPCGLPSRRIPWVHTSVGVAYPNGTWLKKESHLLIDPATDSAESIKARALSAIRPEKRLPCSVRFAFFPA